MLIVYNYTYNYDAIPPSNINVFNIEFNVSGERQLRALVGVQLVVGQVELLYIYIYIYVYACSMCVYIYIYIYTWID